MHRRSALHALAAGCAAATLVGCASSPAPRQAAPAPSPLDRRATSELAPHPRMADLLISAIGLVGVPYRLGGNDVDNGFDCSGLTRHLFQEHLGLALPRRSHEQAGASGFVDVPGLEFQPGDLLFFNTQRRTNSHVGIYIGDGRFVHAPRTGAFVRLESLRSPYWLPRLDGARRLVALAPAPAETSAAR